MKKFIFILTAAVVFISCSKNDNPSDPGTISPGNSTRIKTIAGSGLTTYTYDGQNRILKETHSNGGGYEYEYLPGKVNVKYIGAGGVYQYTDFYELNADGYCKRITNSANAIEDLFFYNPDKSLAKHTYSTNGNMYSIDFFYSNGNCDSTRFSMNGILSYTNKTAYYTDQANVLSYETTGENFFGKVNKNMLKQDYNRFADGSLSVIADYSYEYDAQGRVSKETITKQNNVYVNLYTY